MARRRSSHPLWDGVAILQRLPWWVGVGLAVVSYLMLHRLAAIQPAVIAQPEPLGNVVRNSLLHALAAAGQYIAPLLCLLGAAASAIRRARGRRLLDRGTRNPTAEFLAGISWPDFERLVSEAFRRKGYRVTETGAARADGGVDLVLRRDGETFLVQCKHWRAQAVGVRVARELYGLMAARGAAGGFVVTSGVFTPPAKDFARGRNIELIDGEKLRTMLETLDRPKP